MKQKSKCERLAKLLNNTERATQKAIPVKDIVENNNKEGRQNTVKSIGNRLHEIRGFGISKASLLKDLHSIGLKYKTGDRKNIMHDSINNIAYRHMYVCNRLENINGRDQLIRPEVFLNESYCHVNHHAKKDLGSNWSHHKREEQRSNVEQRRRASMIKDSITVWPAKGSRGVETDYHGNFDKDKFASLFEKLCVSLVPYGNCITHIDGVSYHKNRINKVPTSNTNWEGVGGMTKNKVAFDDKEKETAAFLKTKLEKGLDETQNLICCQYERSLFKYHADFH
ncbi:hypothetical protein EDC96DRAFT_593506 [Choanephora cucurbitarum]|nr:hypothetical protein EDC96DRAFT_593506 [Choanephora cucurbitarum]